MPDVHGHGTTLTVGGTAVGSVLSITGPNKTRQTVDVTSFDSPNRTREHAALRYADSGEAAIELKYVASTATSSPAKILNAVYEASSNVAFVFTMSDAKTCTVSGHITALGHEIPLDDKVTQSVSVKFTGAQVWS